MLSLAVCAAASWLPHFLSLGIAAFMDCIVLAGNRKHYRQVTHEDNKAFLEVNGCPIVHTMLDVLSQVPEIDRLFFVGPKQRLEDVLAPALGEGFRIPVQIFEQKNDLVDNAYAVIDATSEGQPEDRYLLMMPSDIPLLTVEEVREFIRKCDMANYDYVGGLTTQTVLDLYRPTADKPGIQMAYFYCEGQAYRLNNLHMIRPNNIQKSDYIRKTYALRYQKKLRNMLKMVVYLSEPFLKQPHVIFFYMGLQLVRILHSLGFSKMATSLSRRFSLVKLQTYLGKAVGARLKLVTTSYGGSTIDVDNETDFETVNLRFQEWTQMQKDIVTKLNS